MSDAASWMLLTQATDLADRASIARWCWDGLLSSRAKTRVMHLTDLDLQQALTVTENQVNLDGRDWNADALGNPSGSHWVSGNHSQNGPRVFIEALNQVMTSLAIYGIEVRADELTELLGCTAQAPTEPPEGAHGDILSVWAEDAARRQVSVSDAWRDAREHLGDRTPSTLSCRAALKSAITSQGGQVRRGRPPGAKSFNKHLKN